MKTNKLCLIAALLGTALVGCQKVAEIQTPEEKPEVDKAWTLTVQATMDATTRALEMGTDDKSVTAYWKKGEKVAVYFGEALLGMLEVTSDDKVDPATLSGSITKPDGMTNGSELTLLFPGKEKANETDPDPDPWTYLGQNGAEPNGSNSINNFDYAVATFEAAIQDGENTISANTSQVTFENQQSIYRFGFKASGNVVNAQSFMLSTSGGKLVRSLSNSGGTWTSAFGPITVKPTSTADYYYMAVRNEVSSEDVFTFTVVGSDDALYEGTKIIPANAAGYKKFVSAKSIAVAKKAFTPQATTITQESDVL